MRAAIIIASLIVLPALSSAQLLKCVGPDGAVSYSDRPCIAGARPSEVKAPALSAPSERETAEARARHVIDLALAEHLARERRIAALRSQLGQISQAQADLTQQRETRLRAIRCREARRNIAASSWSVRGGMPQIDLLAQQKVINHSCSP